MKAITLTQPWATLIALGLKEFETRSWATKHRGPIAIHAGKTIDKEACHAPAIYSALLKLGIKSHSDLPTGAIIATATLIECHKITSDYYSMYEQEKAGTDKGYLIEGDEWWFGNYEEGRYAWQLSEIQVIDPVPAKGQQRLWNWDDCTHKNKETMAINGTDETMMNWDDCTHKNKETMAINGTDETMMICHDCGKEL